MSITTVSDRLGNLPALSGELDLDEAAFGGLGGLRGATGKGMNAGPFAAIPAPYFALFVVDLDVEPGLNPVVLDGATGQSRDFIVWFDTNTETGAFNMWNANGGTRAEFANALSGQMVIGILVNGTTSEVWINGVKTTTGVNFGSNSLNSLRFLNHNSADQPFEGAALPPLIYKGVPSDAAIERMMLAVMRATSTPKPFSAFKLLGRSNPIPVQRLQGIACDQTYVYLSDSYDIHRLTRGGNHYDLVDSHDTRAEGPQNRTQINGLDIHGGYLWVGANNYPQEPRLGWVLQYDLADMSYVATHELDGYHNEGGAWHDVGNGPEYWAIYHDWPHASRYAWDGTNLTKIGDYLLPIAEGRTNEDGQRGLYQSAQWLGDMLITQTHLNNGTPMTHFHRWTGSGFEAVRESFAFTHNLGQGLFWEKPGEVMLFACRSIGGPQTIVRAAYTGV